MKFVNAMSRIMDDLDILKMRCVLANRESYIVVSKDCKPMFGQQIGNKPAKIFISQVWISVS